MIYFCYTAFWKFYILLSLVANIVRLFWNDRYKRDISKRRRILVSWKRDIIQSLRPSVKNTALFSQKGSLCLREPLRVEKSFFDTKETVEKATKPSEPHSSAYRGTAECGSRRKSKCNIINSFKLIPNQKPKEKLQVTERLFYEKFPYFDGSGSFSTV